MLSLAPFQMVLLNPVQNLGETNLHASIIIPFLVCIFKVPCLEYSSRPNPLYLDSISLSTNILCSKAFAISCHMISTSLNCIHLFDKITQCICLKTTHISSKKNECPLGTSQVILCLQLQQLTVPRP